MGKPCFHVSSISSFLSCLFFLSFFVNSLVSLPFPRPDQIEILMAFKDEFPILKCDFKKCSTSKQITKYWTSKDVNSFVGVEFSSETGVVTELHLRGACLSGSLSANSSLFRFHDLGYLDLSYNYFDSFSFLPELGKLTNLEVLFLDNMGLTGEIPSSFSSLNRLTELVVSENELFGSFSPLLNLSKLSFLDFSNNHFSGNVPSSLLTMPFLSILGLSQNHFIDSLETINCSSSSKLETLYLDHNHLSGLILEPLSKLTNLRYLYLDSQNTTNPINFASSLGFNSLETLYLSGNAISRLNTGSPNLKTLLLDNCNLNEFPTFIKNLQKLEYLDIANNRLKGEVPNWLWSMPSLVYLYLSHNSLDSFEGSPKMLLNSSLRELDLRSNDFRGSLPIISPRLRFMLASNNSFTGDIPLSLCNQSYLGVLDLSHNNFSGSIPRCLITSEVEALNLRNNNLIGRLPDTFHKNSSLISLDVSHNQITGKLPRSLTNCTYLEYLNVEGNRIVDTFPFWLKDLWYLQVIVLRSNMFHGPIYSPHHHLSFPQLQMVDISRNKFTGRLPQDYFVTLSIPLISIPQKERELSYLGDHYWYLNKYNLSMYLRNKGINMELEKILETYTAIDFSENNLGGQIPESIGLLKSLIVLNLSNNDFTGHIPSSWAYLTSLESLDLSQNQLTGKIPQELATLSFLEYINVSHNKLTGQIPHSTQIGGQPKSSFEGNLNLCGLPLEESCFGDKAPSTPEAQEPEPPKQEQVLNWKAAAIGYGPGVLFGLAIGQVLYSYKPVLFFKLFRI
ncbi:PREDICTED: receptor-like protein 12 [Brassica oleracea var. oleracea]|uniref:Leucine-rich repeat-containing N-terminal plant-type domain-containing protein n=1 Tax=Brassica oleracea var. oleracea TaxID=109376 RepID=A0A0D3DYY5_BRAOL|nr:PREDICTED: receptor-like protein 12 [Brassica oleracea var. oleracea]